MSSDYNPKISIITVTYNAEKIIEETILSVINQSYKNIEYIIIDGLSKDGTLDVVNKYADKIDLVVSEKDENNFHAMNKAFSLATGDFIWFLHAGDVAIDNEVLQNAVNQSNESTDFIYGKVKVYNEDNVEREWHKDYPDDKNLTWKSFLDGMIINHQAMLVHRTCWVDYDYKNYALAGDVDWIIRTFKKVKNPKATDFYWCRFSDGGISDNQRKASLKERFAIMQQHYGLFATLKQHFYFALKAINRGSYKY